MDKTNETINENQDTASSGLSCSDLLGSFVVSQNGEEWELPKLTLLGLELITEELQISKKDLAEIADGKTNKLVIPDSCSCVLWQPRDSVVHASDLFPLKSDQ